MIKLLLVLIAGGISVFAYAPFNFPIIIFISLLILVAVVQSELTFKVKYYGEQNFKEGLYNIYNPPKLPRSPCKKVLGYGYAYGISFFTSQLYWIFYSLYYKINTNLALAIGAQLLFVAYLALFPALAVYAYAKLGNLLTINPYKPIKPSDQSPQSFNKLLKSTNLHLSDFAFCFGLTFLLPSLWVLAEWLRGWLLTGFPWCDIGYSQVNLAIMRGFFPIIGEYGVSWLTCSLVGAIYLLIKQGNRFNTRFASIGLATIIISGYLLKNIQYTHSYGKSLSVALMQGNISEEDKWVTNHQLSIYYDQLKSSHADLAIFPETAFPFAFQLPDGYINSFLDYAKQNSMALILGMPKIINANGNYVNGAILITDPKNPYYAKSHLVPFGEYIPLKWLFAKLYKLILLPMVGFSAGSWEQKNLVVDNQKIAFNICYENGFASELIHNAKNSTLMANLSDMVWYGDSIAKDEHLQISQARALENQRYFIQDTNTGMTAVIAPDGLIHSQAPAFKTLVLDDVVQGRSGTTWFEYYGNYLIISWCILIIFAPHILYWLMIKRKA